MFFYFRTISLGHNELTRNLKGSQGSQFVLDVKIIILNLEVQKTLRRDRLDLKVDATARLDFLFQNHFSWSQ